MDINNKISILTITIFAIVSGLVTIPIKGNQNQDPKISKKNKNYVTVTMLVKKVISLFNK